MERLLTPLVNRLLDKFVKKSQEGQTGSFKASLSGVGGFALHNLELDLASVIPPELLECERAFARSLRIKIPWTALNTQPIEVVFETVEILLSDATDRSDAEAGEGIDRQPSGPLSTAESSTSIGGGGGWLKESWLGSNLQSLALRAGLNVSFTIKNLVVKYVDRNAELAATVALEQVSLANVDAASWGHLVDRPEAWLMKNCAIKGLSVGLDRAGAGGGALLPLLRLTSLSVSALLPIFSVVEGVDLGADSTKVAVQVELGAVQGVLNDQQVRWAATLAASLQRCRAATEPPSALEDPPSLYASEDDTSSEPREEMKALGLFNRIWYMAVDEAAYMRNLEAEGDEAPPTPVVPVPTQAELTLSVDSLRMQLAAARGAAVVPLLEAELGPTQLRTASLGTVMQDVEAQVQSFALRHNDAAAGPSSLPPASAPEWDEVLGLHSCEVPLRSGGRLRSATNALELQQCRSGFDGEDPCCVVHVGQVWAAFDPSLLKSVSVFMGALSKGEAEPAESPPPPAAAAAPDSPTETEAGPRLAWLGGSGGWEVDVGAVTAVMRVPGAALAITAAGPVAFRSKAADALGLRCDLSFSLSDSPWEAAASRAGQSSVPGAVPVTNTLSLTGSLGAEGPARRLPFLQLSSLDLDLSGSQVSAFVSCVSGAGSDGLPTEPPLAWATRARLQFSDGISILRRNDNKKAWQIAAPSSSVLIAAAGDDSVAPSAARLDLTSFSCSLSPGLALNTDLACLSVGELGEECEIAAAPLAIVTGVRLEKGDCRQELKFGSLNVMGLPSTVAAAMALKKAMDGGGAAAPVPAELQLRTAAGPAEPVAATSSFAFDTIAFTLFPPSTESPGALPVGVTGWLAGFSSDATPTARRLVLGDAELSLCRLLPGEDAGIGLAPRKVFSFSKVTGRPALEASSTISSHAGGALCEQFTAEVAAVTARVTPELLSALAGLQPPERPVDGAPPTPFIYPASSDPLLHGSTTLGAFRLEVAGGERWGGGVPSSPGLSAAFHVSFDEAFVLLHQESTLSGRPWLQGTRAVASTVTAALLGVGAKVSGHAGGPGADTTQILVPSDINVNLSQWHPTCSSVLAMDVQVLDLKVNAAALAAGTALASAYSTTEPQAPEESPLPPVDPLYLFTDDLRSALFSLSGSSQPFGVALGEGVIEWRYPYPRTVDCIFIEGTSPAEFQAPLLLSCFDDASGEFRHVVMRHVPISKASFVGSCLFPDGDRQPSSSVSGHLWRLAFSLPPGCKDAEDFVKRLYFNPLGPSFWDGAIAPRQTPPPPLATASTLAFSCGYLDVDFLAAHATGHPYISSAHTLNTLASVRMDGVLGALHQWRDGARAADGTMAASVAYTEACTLRSATIVERTEFRIAYEKGSMELAADQAVDGVSHLAFLLSQAAGGLAAMDWVGSTRLATRLYPLSRGDRLQVDLPSPLVVNISELAVLDLQRIIAGFNAPLSSPIGMWNAASTAVMFKQCGSTASTLLRAGEEAEFHLVPAGGDHGMLLGVQLCLPPAPGQQPEWSDPIDVMTGGGASVPLKGASYSNTSIAVMVVREGHRWCVHLADGLRIYNRQDSSLHLLLPQISGMQRVEVAFNGCTDISLTSGVSVTHLRFWLGKEWSIDMSAFDKAGEVQVLQADSTFESEAPACGPRSVPLLARCGGVDPSTGHLAVEIWPPITIFNKLSIPVAIKLSTDGDTFVLEPAASLAIPVGVEGGMVARVFGAPASGSTVPDRAPLLFCPPLAPHSDSFLLSHGLAETPKSASDVVYITSPGEAADFDLPCHGVGKVPCLLLTDPDADSPGLSLQLQPRWQAINKTGATLELQVPGCGSVCIPPQGAMAMALQGASSSSAVLALIHAGTRLSGEFSLNVEECRVLLVDDKKERLAWAGVELRRTEMGQSSALEIIVSHGFLFQNLTDSVLFLREPPNEAKEHSPLSLAPASSLPTFSLPDYYEVGINVPSSWQPVPVVSKPFFQGKLYFETGQTVSYCTVKDAISETLVFYRDPDPLVRLLNSTGTVFDLSWTSGEEQFIASVHPSQAFEFELDAQKQSIASDDIFLSTYPEDHPLRQTCTGGLLLIRSDPEEEWLDVIIEEGDLVVGTFSVAIQRRGRGVDLTIKESSSLSNGVEIETLEACLHCKEIRLVVLDDERGRVVGRNCAHPTRLLSVTLAEVDLAFSRSSASSDPCSVNLAAAVEVGEMSLATCFPAVEPFMWAQSQISGQMEAIMSSASGIRSVCLKELSATVPPISLRVDDASVQLYMKFKTLLQTPEGFANRENEGESATAGDATDAVLEMASGRIYLDKLAISKLDAVADIHLTTNSGLPVAVDTERSPLSISKTVAENISLPVRSILDGVVAHFLAQAVLNAPLLLGSLQLFFNPTGLVRSIQRGVADMIDLPMQGLQRGGALEFLAGVGHGSVSLVREVSGWSMSSIVGFSKAASNALFKRSSSSLGESDDLPGREGDRPRAGMVYAFSKIAETLILENELGDVILHAEARSVLVHQVTADVARPQAVFQLPRPVVILTTRAAIIYSDSGLTPSLVAWLDEALVSKKDMSLEIMSRRAAPFSNLQAAGAATISAEFSPAAWARIGPSLRKYMH